jgi:hypothetical protein
MPQPPAAKSKNPLIDIFGAGTRRVIYFGYALIGLILGSAQAWMSAVESPLPTWFKGAFAVYAYVGGAIGLTAASNSRDARD